MLKVDTDYAVDTIRTMFQYSRDKLFTDFKLRAGGRTAHCHQGIISAKSSYFHALCSSGVREAMLDHPISKEEDSQVLDAVVEFLYLGNCNITTHNVTSLLMAADFIKLTELKKKCEKYMATKLTTGNLLTYHKLAKKTHLSELCDECVHLSKKNFSEVARSDWILSLSYEEFHDYLGDDQLNVKDEDEVLAALERYVRNSQEASAVKDRYIEDLFACVKIQFCTPATLEAMSKDKTVTGSLRLKILEYLQHGFHGEGTARLSYSSACRARQERAHSGKLSSSAASVSSASGTLAKPGTSPARKPGTSPPRKPGTSPPRKRAKSSTSGAIHKLPKPSASAAPLADNQEEILIVGGLKTGLVPHPNIVFLDNESNTSIPTTGTILTDSYYYSVCANKFSMIVSGGRYHSTKSSMSRVQIFDINGNTWTDLPDLPHPVHFHGSALVDGNFFSIGGRCTEEDTIKHRYSTVHRLHIQTATWSECQGLPIPVDNVGVATIEDDILVIGGWTDDGWSTQTCRYNTTTNKMITCQPMPRADSVYYSTVAVGHRIYVLARSLFLSYDVRADQWSRLSRPMKPSHRPALVLKQHTLIAMGGYDEDYKKPNDRVQVYDIRNNTWSLEDRTMPLELTHHWAFAMKMRK